MKCLKVYNENDTNIKMNKTKQRIPKAKATLKCISATYTKKDEKMFLIYFGFGSRNCSF